MSSHFYNPFSPSYSHELVTLVGRSNPIWTEKRAAVETLREPGLELNDIAEQMHLPLEPGHALCKRSEQSGEVETFLKFHFCSLDLKINGVVARDLLVFVILGRNSLHLCAQQRHI